MPAGWRARREVASGLEIAFWDQKELLLYVAAHRDRAVTWGLPSYSKMLYLLAFLAVERKDYAAAEGHVRRGLELEPDHPHLLCELALAREHESMRDALDAYKRATTAHEWDPRWTARAHRGVGFTLIEIGALDGAEAAFKRSLEVEPGNTVALHELEVVREMRERGLTADDYRRSIERSGGPPAR
jgi:tetratricopeptide (TPR) repeat protein